MRLLFSRDRDRSRDGDARLYYHNLFVMPVHVTVVVTILDDDGIFSLRRRGEWHCNSESRECGKGDDKLAHLNFLLLSEMLATKNARRRKIWFLLSRISILNSCSFYFWKMDLRPECPILWRRHSVTVGRTTGCALRSSFATNPICARAD